MDRREQPRPLARGVNAAAPYVTRPPSPPYIHIPSISQEGLSYLSIMPSFSNVDSGQLTDDDLSIITQNKAQLARDNAASWRYESRREAQPVLDFLYLGPSSIVRDHAFLKREGITMLLCVRDSRFAQANFMRASQAAQTLGVKTEYIDVASNQELIRASPVAVKLINDHMLNVYRSQAVLSANETPNLPEGKMFVDSANFRRGKVLVFCETGNDRSAAIVAAYIMTVFGVDLIRTIQFISLQRFCTNFDDEAKYWLKSYEDILNARRTVQRGAGQKTQTADAIQATISRAHGKRGIEDTMDEDEGEESGGGGIASGFSLDSDRYLNRQFAPFIQREKNDRLEEADEAMGD